MPPCPLYCGYLQDVHNYLPSKGQWKRELSNAIWEREKRLWLTRVDHDPDFWLFKHIQNAITPSVIWQYPATRLQLSLSSLCCCCKLLLRSQIVETVYAIYVGVCIHIGLYIFCQSVTGLSHPGTDSLITKTLNTEPWSQCQCQPWLQKTLLVLSWETYLLNNSIDHVRNTKNHVI